MSRGADDDRKMVGVSVLAKAEIERLRRQVGEILDRLEDEIVELAAPAMLDELDRWRKGRENPGTVSGHGSPE